MVSNNFIKNITSKDLKLSQNTILNMLKTANIEEFSELCEKSDFIFPFLKERIINDFIKLVNKEDLKTIFEFAKIYCCDFEDLIVKSWVKFADEDLTDEILEILEHGTLEQKTYGVLYFKYIKDLLVIEYLNILAKADDDNLRLNCAIVLSSFQDKTIYNEMKEIILKSNDDFEKLRAFSFLSAYQGKESIEFIIKEGLNNPFRVNIITNLLDYNELNIIKNYINDNDIINIFNILIEAYPEDISLNTISYYNILDFIKIIEKIKSNYANNSLILAKIKFREFFENEIYSFDLDKNLKTELKNIFNYLNSLNLSYETIKEELNNYNSNSMNIVFNIIQEEKLNEYSINIANLINNNLINSTFIAKAVVILKELNQTNLINKEILNNINDENIKALIQSCLNN